MHRSTVSGATNYTIASDPRFKAATSGAGISNILAGYGSTSATMRPSSARRGSISIHVDRIVTPTLFLAGDKDFNVPLLNSEQMYQALRSRGVDTELVIYPGQFHGLKSASFVRDRYQRYVDWYARHLK